MSTQIKKFTEDTVGTVLAKVAQFSSEGGLKLPDNYSAENALRSAFLILQETVDLNKRPALEVCTKESVANALLDTVLQGLSPSKKQCYYIVYGNKLVMQRSYMGTMAVGKRVAGIKEVVAIAIYENDVFEYAFDFQTGRKNITKHDQNFENINPQKVKGAYAIAIFNDGTTDAEVMNMEQIRTAWEMGKAKGNSPAHQKFPDEMAKKTVVSRLLKTKIGSSDDSDLFDEIEIIDTTAAYVENEVTQNANKETLDIDSEDVIENEIASYDVEVEEIENEEEQPVATSGPGF
ncbi:MAG: recombinase RecT [Bacteroidetes bacterium]|nr:recombinase RecT [Bacteroidota bacterium]